MSNCFRSISLWAIGCAVLAAQPEPAPQVAKGFTIIILQGDGVLNPLPRPPATRVSLRVADPKGQPIRNAVTVFELPEAGASAKFSDGSPVKVILTNEQGEAVADLKSNEVPGKYQATVTVNYLGQSSLVKLNQENAFPYGTPSAVGNRLIQKHGLFTKKTVLIIAGVAIAGAVGTVAAHHGGGSGSSQTTTPPGGIVITPGTGTVGGH